jgi:hypothetical protein
MDLVPLLALGLGQDLLGDLGGLPLVQGVVAVAHHLDALVGHGARAQVLEVDVV